MYYRSNVPFIINMPLTYNIRLLDWSTSEPCCCVLAVIVMKEGDAIALHGETSESGESS